jgi:hypothetical protein
VGAWSRGSGPVSDRWRHFDALLEPPLDSPDVAPVVQRIAVEREKAGLVALTQEADPPLREDRARRLFGPELEERPLVEDAERKQVLGFEHGGIADVVAADRNHDAAVDQGAQACALHRPDEGNQSGLGASRNAQRRDDDGATPGRQPRIFGAERQRRGITRIYPGQVRRDLPDGGVVEGIGDHLGHPLLDGRKCPGRRGVHDFVHPRVDRVAEVRAVDDMRRHAQAAGVRAVDDQA